MLAFWELFSPVLDVFVHATAGEQFVLSCCKVWVLLWCLAERLVVICFLEIGEEDLETDSVHHDVVVVDQQIVGGRREGQNQQSDKIAAGQVEDMLLKFLILNGDLVER